MKILNCLAASAQERGLTEISKQLAINKSAVYRILSSLERLHWVVQDPNTEKYTLGIGLLETSTALMSHLDVRSASRPYLQKLRDVTTQTSMLHLRVGLERIVLEQIPGGHGVYYLAVIGGRLPLWAGSHGKAILAFLQEDEIEEVLNHVKMSEERTYASGQPIDVNTIRKQIITIREKRFSVATGEVVATTTGVAAPIFSSAQRVVGALGIIGSLPRLTLEVAEQYGPLVREFADEISLQLGYVGRSTKTDTANLKWLGKSPTLQLTPSQTAKNI